MVTLQILVLSFLVRVRVSQLLHHCHQSLTCILGYGVMVTLQILVLSFLVRVRVSQLVSIFQNWKMLFFVYNPCMRNLDKQQNPGQAPWVLLFYLFSASIALIFCLIISRSALSFSTLRFISSTRLLPFLLAALRKPRLFS